MQSACIWVGWRSRDCSLWEPGGVPRVRAVACPASAHRRGCGDGAARCRSRRGHVRVYLGRVEVTWLRSMRAWRSSTCSCCRMSCVGPSSWLRRRCCATPLARRWRQSRSPASTCRWSVRPASVTGRRCCWLTTRRTSALSSACSATSSPVCASRQRYNQLE